MLREQGGEMLFIKFQSREDEARGSFVLSRAGVTYCLPDGVYACKESQLEEVKTTLTKESIRYSIEESKEKGRLEEHSEGHTIVTWPNKGSRRHDNIPI